jgi:hypothetical protein
MLSAQNDSRLAGRSPETSRNEGDQMKPQFADGEFQFGLELAFALYRFAGASDPSPQRELELWPSRANHGRSWS